MSRSRDQIIAAIKLQLDETNAVLNELEKKAAGASDEAQAKYQEQLARLQKQSDDVQDKLQELADAGEDAWGAMVAEAEKVRDAFIHSFHYFKSQLK